MSDEQKIDEKDLSKALSALQDLAKGHSSKGTNTTAVDSMDSESGATQVFHTPSDSDPGTWAGSTGRDCPDNGATDAISDNGTDYDGGAEMVKSIKEKLSKGQALTAEEYSFVMEKGMPPFMKKDDDDDKDDKKVSKAADEDDKDVKKSLADEAASSETVSQGMEISEFLADFVGVFSKSLASAEGRITRSVLSAVSAESQRSEAFGKSLAGALGTISEGLVAQTQRVDQFETTPARGPKSHQASSEPVSKSFAGPGGDKLSKSEVADALVDMVQKSLIDGPTVIAFDSTGQISDDTYAKVVAHRAGK